MADLDAPLLNSLAGNAYCGPLIVALVLLMLVAEARHDLAADCDLVCDATIAAASTAPPPSPSVVPGPATASNPATLDADRASHASALSTAELAADFGSLVM